MRAERRDDEARAVVAAVLSERLRSADEEIAVPADLWERVRERGAVPEKARRDAGARRRRTPWASPRGRLVLVLVAAVAVALVGSGTWMTLNRPTRGSVPAHKPAPTTSAPAPPHRDWVALRVYNVEKPCRPLRTMECAMRLARSPYKRYAQDDNSAGHVWHGDRLLANCVVTDGQLVRDETGLSSTRWYHVRKAAGGPTGWLPGVRTRNTREIPVCTREERPAY